ncbi:MAG: AMP-binding protein, partial [Betaproteobacteria bacterium]|nr:AMP-binding protein [Betaproteobacteria bacterium]
MAGSKRTVRLHNGYLDNTPYSATTVTGSLLAIAHRAPHSTALQRERECTTFAELVELGEHVAAGLAAQGISRGDRVAVWLPNCAEWLA